MNRQSYAAHMYKFAFDTIRIIPKCLLFTNSKKPFGDIIGIGRLNWNTLKGNQAPIQKFERPNRKIPKSDFFTSRPRTKGLFALCSLMKGVPRPSLKSKFLKFDSNLQT